MKKSLPLILLLLILWACSDEPEAEALGVATAPTETPRSFRGVDIIAPAPSGRSLQPQISEADIPLDEIVTPQMTFPLFCPIKWMAYPRPVYSP